MKFALKNLTNASQTAKGEPLIRTLVALCPFSLDSSCLTIKTNNTLTIAFLLESSKSSVFLKAQDRLWKPIQYAMSWLFHFLFTRCNKLGMYICV